MTNFFVTLTLNCDLECLYCDGECCDCFDDFDDGIAVDYDVPEEISYKPEILRDFIAKDPEAVVIFYGGEPLLRMDRMLEYMDLLPAKHFMLHTNATHLGEVPAAYLRRLHTISVSIDGDRELTDYYRGEGVYDTIIRNVKAARAAGYTGEIIARMTVQEETDIYKQVLHLLDNPDFCFDSVHWQLNALFWRNDYLRRDFAGWTEKEYNPGVRKLIGKWLDVMRTEGRVLRIYPFIGLMNSLLRNETTHLRCGAGWAEYSIQTDGNISPCPVMVAMPDYYTGNITRNSPDDLKVIHVSGLCKDCDILGICGGRCLYANATMKWGEKGFREVCATIRFLIGSLKEVQPEIEKMIADGKIKASGFDQEIGYNSCEIIP